MERFLITKTKDAADLPLPKYMTEAAAGMDLYANIKDNISVSSGEIILVPTGISIALPKGFEAQIRPRSGLALNYGISIVNSPGTIDADYRGEIKIILINHGKIPFEIKRGDRIAQMVVTTAPQILWEEVETLPASDRNGSGFGHTGNN